MSAGPALIDVLGLALAEDDRRRLRHPACGGVILFARNYQDPAQLGALVREIRALRRELLVCVDHEGGRVQRFRAGFTQVPPMRRLGELWDRDRAAARRAAHAVGVVIATELAAHGLDFSFTPVLDLDYAHSAVIGDRALHADPEAVGELAAALLGGLAACGVAAVGKHFPGHGYAQADSHVAVPVDERPLAQILARDVAPYRAAIAAGLAGVMPAHVIYPHADPEPAGYSRFWLQEVLRRQLGFDGLIFSDDLSMEGASGAGGVAERARAALAAGCDMVLLCNDPAGQDRLLDSLAGVAPSVARRVARMRLKDAGDRRSSAAYREAVGEVSRLA
ncbi:MAG TPA: beta-N-acetylhexosaminidase [Burkholderiales bacterium]|nr:beta-N-acetylhexosaminidase [Burkholderiales bacterium]